ncbi:MAG: ABC transporter permease [Acidimicrobiia bacterium]|nr:ABC transporter permease [Acidimicrobiia bacterium]
MSADMPVLHERPQVRLVWTIARKELRDSIRDRWFWLFAGGFALLAAGLAVFALSNSQVVGFGGFGRTAASLIALVQLVVPLMGLTLGARSIAGQREAGTLRFLLSHPVSRTEVFFGLLGGIGAALLAAIAAGFGVAGLVSAARGSAVDAADLLGIALSSWLLSLAMLAVGILISTLARRAGTALGTALFVWLVFTFVGDLGLMGASLATDLPVNVLFFSTLVNPVEAFRLLSMLQLEGTLDVLGPAGSYAIDTFGGIVAVPALLSLVVWTAVPLAVAWWVFARRSDV